jgi:phosphatidylethanolamine/phosphatidyl-N-methylethanolamine N-methyltransferase
MPFDLLEWNRYRYGLWAPIYAPVTGLMLDRMRRRAVGLLAPCVGEDVLIVGAGPGLDLPHIPSGVNLTAIDLAPGMIKRLQRRARRLRIPIDARVMDAQALEFPDASFDAALLNLIIAIVPDPVRCAREVVRVLRPAGRAVIFDKFAPDNRPVPLVLRAFNPVARLIGSDVTRQLGHILAESGLQLIHRESAGLGGFLKIAVVRRG